MNITSKTLIESFLNGATDGISGSRSNPGNLKIVEDKLFHYNTVIAERCGDKILVNYTRYSVQTGRVQKILKELVPEDKFVQLMHVPIEYRESLKKYIQ